jgi:hypothetical protein
MFNASFDGSLLTYDTDYDNHVESPAFERYYRELAAMLIERFQLSKGDVVYDVGCGRGTFLKTLCALAPSVTGIGIDPSCDPVESGNFRLIRSTFSQEIIGSDAKLVLLRHVLEHIDRPVSFLSDLRKAIGRAPLFVEVPDTTWIFDNGAFWDFCYEHCNYFVPETLRQALSQAGLRVLKQEVSFGRQYQWAICQTGAPEEDHGLPLILELAERYRTRESTALRNANDSLKRAATRGPCAIWGMATKGVVLTSILGPDLIAGGVDSNPRKQGRFAPGSGVEIHPPGWLALFDDKATAFVMNPNYLEEIRTEAQRLEIKAELRPIVS